MAVWMDKVARTIVNGAGFYLFYPGFHFYTRKTYYLLTLTRHETVILLNEEGIKDSMTDF